MDISGDSLEHLFYYKDFRPREETTTVTTTTTTAAAKLLMRAPLNPRKNCCCCCTSNSCNEGNINIPVERQLPEPSEMGSMSESMSPIQPIQSDPERKKIMTRMHQPLWRRSGGVSFTKDHIKKLISHDEDIKKILRDLVRVTMQKINVLDMIKASGKREKENVKTEIVEQDD